MTSSTNENRIEQALLDPLHKANRARENLNKLKKQVKKIFPISLTFCLLWFLANYFYNFGLLYASVTSSVVLSNTSPAWVYILSISCLVPAAFREKFNWVCAAMIVVSMSGFVLIAVEDKNDSTDETEKPILGDALSLLSALSYGFYATYLKIKVPESEEATFKFSYFLGFVGLCNDVLLIPLFFIFNATGFETFEWPDKHTLLLLSINALVGTCISDYCWGKSVILLGPFVTTLGITITFPLSAIFDTVVNGAKFTWLYFLGSILIFAAFGVIMVSEWRRKKRQEEEEKQRLGNIGLRGYDDKSSV
eukprot:CAMPEP_0185588252 /NCGR_PEP_ID=MMETSP0434-20130131/52314_1 /TAXON_ID=626734 ORGANISM="Favella taraikaensis, Strain Fe Narragansett Bay" /NCGR_SAMPLE_ID=MMETSP0434 /ASSEMBLY_ACC=CAM_ASM_000379 /LENGTH=306 /DNA_ID=CAMNT_0028210759 /DNA_START=203 /DNA_END=1119 /DNA_ORIENTATION=-